MAEDTTREARAPNNFDNGVKAILATNITVYRNALKLSRAELAERVGITEAAIGQYERGTRTPQIDIICKLANVFNVPVDKLVGHNAGEYDAVKEYRFDETIRFVRNLGYSVVETEEGIVKVSARYKPVVRFTQSVATVETVYAGGLKEVIKFNNRETFISFFESLINRFLFADGARPIVEEIINTLNSTGKVELPSLEVKKQDDLYNFM